VLGELRTQWLGASTSDAELFVRAIKRATKTANEQINSYATSHPEYRGMGTTATIAGLLGNTLYLAQVGDSRAYLVRQGVARQITKDQSLMQKLIEAGELTEEEAEHSERRNIILQALGPDSSVKVDLTHQTVRRGDILVLCSDGLSGQVSKDEIALVVATEPHLETACELLIQRANEAGGPDNITVIVARFEGEGLQAATVEDEVGHRAFPLNDTRATPAVPMPRPSPTSLPSVDGDSGSPSGSAGPLPPLGPPPPMFEPTVPATISTALPAARPMPSTPPRARTRLINAADLKPPPVSPARRSTGMLIAMALLIALILSAAWLVVRTAQNVTPKAADSATKSNVKK
jgi:protein phosphatase